MKSKLRRIVTNPITITLPIVVIIMLAWQHYTYAGLALSMPRANQNVLKNGTFTQLSKGIPIGWELQQHGSLAYRVSHSTGYVSGKDFNLEMTRYKQGDLTLTSPKMAVSSRTTYVFKGYYKSTTTFSLLARYYYSDNTSQLQFLQTYADNSGVWSTVSNAFKTNTTITAVQYVYSFASVGTVQLNGLYLEPASNVAVPAIVTGKNNMPNPTLASSSVVNMPTDWAPYAYGKNSATFAYDHDSSGAYVSTSLTGYQNGEAKWQYEAQSVAPHQYEQVGVTYRSDVPATIEAEFVMRDGTRQFSDLSTLVPADSWTHVSTFVEAPANVKTMQVSVVLRQNGTLVTRSYSLIAATKPGVPSWSYPLISIAFDDGWQSAYTTAVPILNQYHYKSTFYINPSSIETPDFMTADELTTLYSHGNEIAAHGYAHDDMVALNDTALTYQLQKGRDYLREAGYPVSDFATPYGDGDDEVTWYAKQYFQTMRGTDTGLNTKQNLDPYNLKILYIDGSVSSSDVAAALAQAKAYSGWLILVYHRVGDIRQHPATVKVESTTTSAAAFRQQMQLVQQSNIPVATIKAAYQEVKNQ